MCVVIFDALLCYHAAFEVDFMDAPYTVSEGDGSVEVCVSATGELVPDLTMTVTIATSDGTASKYIL